MITLQELSSAHLRKALQLRGQIQSLQRKLEDILGGKKSTPGAKPPEKAGRPAGKRTMSAEGRAKIAAAQKARWARVKRSAAKATRAGRPAAKAKKKSGLAAKR